MKIPNQRMVRRAAASFLAELLDLSPRKIVRGIAALPAVARTLIGVLAVGALWLAKRAKRRITRRLIAISLLVLVPAAVGTPLALTGYHAMSWQSAQVSYYNQAMAIYRDAVTNQDPYELPQAIALFQQSIDAYNAQDETGVVGRILHGTPDTELLAQAYFHEGLSYLIEGSNTQDQSQITQALQYLKQAIQVNPGTEYAASIRSGDITQLAQEALPPIYDLELLYMQNPQQANGTGGPPQPGAGQQPGQGTGKQGTQPGSGSKNGNGHKPTSKNPSNVTGHGSSGGI